MSPWLLYIVLKMDDFIGVFHGLMAMSIIATVILGILAVFQMDCQDEALAKKFIKWWRLTIPLAIGLCVVATLLPTTKQVAAIYLLPKMINNEQVQSMSGNSLKILEKYTENVLQDMTDKIVDKAGKALEGDSK